MLRFFPFSSRFSLCLRSDLPHSFLSLGQGTAASLGKLQETSLTLNNNQQYLYIYGVLVKKSSLASHMYISIIINDAFTTAPCFTFNYISIALSWRIIITYFEVGLYARNISEKYCSIVECIPYPYPSRTIMTQHAKKFNHINAIIIIMTASNVSFLRTQSWFH